MRFKVSGLDGLFCESVADKFSVDACIIHVAAMPVIEVERLGLARC